MHFLDFNIDKNKCDYVYYSLKGKDEDELGKEIEEEEEKEEEGKKIKNELKISNKIEYIIISYLTMKKYEYYPINLTLYNSKNKKDTSVTFTIYIYQGIMNKLNVFINKNCENPFFYEFFYYNINGLLGTVEKNIIIENKNYNINIFDDFGSENRKRLCIMNIPYQKIEISEDDLNSNSIQICELIKDDFHKITGIYDISFDCLNEEKTIDFFAKYYNDFGDIFDLMNNFSIDSKIIEKTLNKKMKIYNDSIKLDFDLTNAFIFENSMTLSHFKARVGLIICKFINDYNNKIVKIIKEVRILFYDIKNKNLKYSEIIRILLYTLQENIKNNYFSNVELKFVSELDKKSPYFIAYEFNKERIKNLTEFSPLFQCYLQLNSYKAYNYIHHRESYSFSLELNFMIKHQLLSLYEDFFYVKRAKGKEFALLDGKTNITVINEFTSFGKNFDESDIIKNTEKAYNYAMLLSLHFVFEKHGHYKYALKNNNIFSTLIYYRGLNIEIEMKYFEENYLSNSGIMVKNFICDDKNIIYELSTKFVFGEFLKKEYFDGKDFKNLIKAVKDKLKNYNNINSNSIVSNKNEKDKGYNEVSPFPKLRYMERHCGIQFDVNDYKRTLQISEDEKKATFFKYCIRRKKRITELKKIFNKK